MNIISADDAPTYWVFDGEEIICEELGGGNRNGKKWYKDCLNRKYRRKDKQFFKIVKDESDEEI